MKSLKVCIDPSANIPYSSFYIKGLYEVLGKSNVKFASEYFLDLDHRKEEWSFDSYMALVFFHDQKMWNVIIDFGDDVPIRQNAYEWCDLYAKINYCPEKTGEFKKVVSIPPGFGIRIWKPVEIIRNCIVNLIQLRFRPHTSIRNHFRFYLSQLKALPLEKFVQKDGAKERPNSIFFVSSLWPHQNCLEGTNLLRKSFMESCRKAGADFEGGFLLLEESHPQKEKFAEFVFKKRYPLSIFVEKTKKSALVFNTPAVHNCHGWKLGQYLAMGKAIISTPFQNALPEDLVHGKNIHFVHDASEMDAAVSQLLKDENYRKKLEEGARAYSLKYVSPSAVISRIARKLKSKAPL